MTNLNIQTRITEGHGYIEMRPKVDDYSWSIINKLELPVVHHILESEDTGRERTGLAFEHMEQAKLDKTANSIAEALSLSGCLVTFNENSLAEAKPVHAKPWAKKIIHKLSN